MCRRRLCGCRLRRSERTRLCLPAAMTYATMRADMAIADTAQLFQQLERFAQADGKEAYYRLHRHRYAATLEALRAPAWARVLEVGVNPGQFTQLLVGRGYRVSGVDLNPAPRQALWD